MSSGATKPDVRGVQPHFSVQDLTISVSTIGRTETLKAALRSLIHHEPAGMPLQVILNDAPDTLRQLEPELNTWPGDVRVLEVDARMPIAASHQFALEQCTTSLINFMGDDDLCLDARMDRVIALFNAHPDLQIVGSWASRIGGPIEHPRVGGRMDLGPASIKEWQEYRTAGKLVQFCFPASVYRCDGLRAIGGIEERWAGAFDVAITARLSSIGPAIALTDRPFGFRIHEGSVSSTSFEDNHNRVRYVRRCQPLFEAGMPEPSYAEFLDELRAAPRLAQWRERRSVRSRQFFRRAGGHWLDGNHRLALQAAAGSFVSSPSAFFRKLNDQRGHRSR